MFPPRSTAGEQHEGAGDLADTVDGAKRQILEDREKYVKKGKYMVRKWKRERAKLVIYEKMRENTKTTSRQGAIQSMARLCDAWCGV